MELRSITLFAEPTLEDKPAAAFFSAARKAFHVPVQTLRVATTPFPTWWNQSHLTSLQAKETADRWQALGADYICLGPVKLGHDAGWLNILPEIIASHDALFVSAEIAGLNGTLDLGRCRSVAEIIRRISTLQGNGFSNLYFAALANCRPGSPFFPVAYHAGGSPCFAIAVESAGLAVSALQDASSLLEVRNNLISAIEREAVEITAVAQDLAAAHDIAFKGIDFSLAPYPTPEKSLGGAMEALGLEAMGAPGTLFAAAFLTDALGRADYPRCGFSGLMLPVLEDSVVAARAGQGAISISDLLSYSAVCGVGLDTVPLPGAISLDALTGILLDVSGLALRLDKPLVARLMPLPGLEAGDPIHFDFPYFADSRVMDLRHQHLGPLLISPSQLDIQPIHDRNPS